MFCAHVRANMAPSVALPLGQEVCDTFPLSNNMCDLLVLDIYRLPLQRAALRLALRGAARGERPPFVSIIINIMYTVSPFVIHTYIYIYRERERERDNPYY